MALYSLMLHSLTFSIEIDDKMLSAVIGGAMVGLGTAIMLRSYGSTGGAEILYILAHKVFSITLGTGAMILNGVILTIAASFFPVERVLYTLICMIVSARTTDVVFHGLAKRQAAIIISDK